MDARWGRTTLHRYAPHQSPLQLLLAVLRPEVNELLLPVRRLRLAELLLPLVLPVRSLRLPLPVGPLVLAVGRPSQSPLG